MPHFIEKTLQRIDKLDRDHIRAIMSQLYHDHRRLEEVINSLPDGIVVLDKRHRAVINNRAAQLLLPLRDRRDKEEAIWELVDDEQISGYLRQALQQRNKTDSASFSLGAKGNVRTLYMEMLPLVGEGKIIGNILRVTDITEKLANESRLYRAEQLASLTTLTANVAHEIKNPLGSISIYIQLIKREMQKNRVQRDAVSRHLTIVEEEIQRLNSTIVDFLFSMRPMALVLEESDIHPLLDEVITLFEPEMRDVHITLTTRYTRNLPRVEIDRKYMKQAIMNIIKNAIEAIGGDDTGDEKGDGEIIIQTAAVAEGIRIEIIDNGAGMSDNDISNAFDPYFTTKDNGSGIGLTQTYKVIREHRGEIAIANNAAAGATCTIILPLPRKQQKLIIDSHETA